MELMTEAQYVKSSGLLCPRCKKKKVASDEELEANGKHAFQNVYCDICGAYWTDRYDLVGYSEFNN